MYAFNSAFLINNSLFSIMNSIRGSFTYFTNSPKITENKNKELVFAISSKTFFI